MTDTLTTIRAQLRRAPAHGQPIIGLALSQCTIDDLRAQHYCAESAELGHCGYAIMGLPVSIDDTLAFGEIAYQRAIPAPHLTATEILQRTDDFWAHPDRVEADRQLYAAFQSAKGLDGCCAPRPICPIIA